MPSQNNYHETFWRQLLRYLVSTTPKQFDVAAERDVYVPGDTVSLRSEINDKKFDAIRDAQVMATVTKPSGATVELPLKINFSDLEPIIGTNHCIQTGSGITA